MPCCAAIFRESAQKQDNSGRVCCGMTRRGGGASGQGGSVTGAQRSTGTSHACSTLRLKAEKLSGSAACSKGNDWRSKSRPLSIHVTLVSLGRRAITACMCEFSSTPGCSATLTWRALSEAASSITTLLGFPMRTSKSLPRCNSSPAQLHQALP